MMSEEIKKWWEDNSKRFQIEHNIPIDISYGPWMPTEDKLKLIGPIKGKKVLEIGCGGAQCGIGFAKKGAQVTGIDLSIEQLNYAQRLCEKNKVKIKLLQGNITNLKQIKSNSQDIVFSSWALFYVKDLKKCFKEVFRVLKKGGIFVFSTEHPIWQVISKKNMKIKANYFNGETHIEERGAEGKFVSYKHPLSEITESLYKSKLKIERILEPNPKKYKKYSSEIVNKRAIEGMKQIPRTIIFKTIK